MTLVQVAQLPRFEPDSKSCSGAFAAFVLAGTICVDEVWASTTNCRHFVSGWVCVYERVESSDSRWAGNSPAFMFYGLVKQSSTSTLKILYEGPILTHGELSSRRAPRWYDAADTASTVLRKGLRGISIAISGRQSVSVSNYQGRNEVVQISKAFEHGKLWLNPSASKSVTRPHISSAEAFRSINLATM